MSTHFLGLTFDIHGGGKDLLFPHHENERAQSIGAYGGEFARYWVHNGFVTVESEKMSKSLGNFLTIRDALKIYHPEVLRLFLLSKHYRSPLDFSSDAISSMQAGFVRIYRTLERLEDILGPYGMDYGNVQGILKDIPDDPFLRRFIDTMDDDINTASAIGLLFDKIREINRILVSEDQGEQQKERLIQDRKNLLIGSSILGVLEDSPVEFFERIKSGEIGISREEIERLIEERASARARKDWKKADAIRDHLKKMGIVLEDTRRGTRWRFDV
jgi:cysteinyl-tRNA synthetase